MYSRDGVYKSASRCRMSEKFRNGTYWSMWCLTMMWQMTMRLLYYHSGNDSSDCNVCAVNDRQQTFETDTKRVNEQ